MNESKQERLNFYILLELPYDPPVEDNQQIQAAITKKISEWRKQTNTPKIQNQVREYLRLRPEIERVMLHDKAARKQEAKNAKAEKEKELLKARKAREEDLDIAIRIQISKGHISDEEIELLANTFNFTVAEVESKIPKDVRVKASNDSNSVTKFKQAPSLDTSKINTINRILVNLGILPKIGKIPTLYDFLNMPEDTDGTMMMKLAKDLNQKLAKMPPGKASVDDQKELCGLIISIFKTSEERQKYEESLNRQRFEKLKLFIDLTAEKNGVITAPTFQQLIIQAGKEGLSQAEAETRSKVYFEEKKYALLVNQEQHSVQEHQKLRQCVNCGTVNEKETKYCVSCGSELEQKCSICQTVSPIGSQHCRSCGTSFKQLIHFNQLFQDGYAALKLQDLDRAEQLFIRAQLLFDQDEVRNALNSVKQKKQQLDIQIQLVKKLIQQKKFFTAEIECNKLKKMAISVGEAVIFQREISQVLHEIGIIKGGILPLQEVQEKITAYVKMLQLSIDCQWAINQLKQVTPIPPVHLRAEKTDEGMRLSWTLNEPEGFVQYKIVRKENIAPTRIDDGELLATTTKPTFTDSNIEFCKTYWYAIFSTRDEHLISKPVIRGPYIRIAEVTDLVATPKNNGIQLTWKEPMPIEVEVWRKEDSAPHSYGDGTLLKSNIHHSFFDENVILGNKYKYTLFTKLVDAKGKTTYSKGVSVELFMINATPVTDLVGEIKGDTIECTWTGTTKEPVKLYQTTTVHPFKDGECLPMNIISQKLSAVSYIREGVGQASISKPTNNELCIVPITIAGDYGIVGNSCSIKVVPSITNIKTTLKQNQCLIEWDWPQGIDAVSIATSETQCPKNPNNSQQQYSKAQYNQNGGLVLQLEPETDLYITIFAQEKSRKQLYFSKGVHTIVSTKTPPKMAYLLGIKGFFSKKVELVIKIEDDQYIIPELVIVKKKGSQPLNQADGEEICTIGPIFLEKSSNGKKEAEHTNLENIVFTGKYIAVNLTSHYDKNSYIRIFFKNAQDAERFFIEPLGKMNLG